jgi:hypothetical protein
MRWKVLGVDFAIALLITLSSLAAVQGIKLQQLTLVVAALLALCFFFLSKQRYVVAGVCLALATVKPQLAVLPAIWLVLWAGSKWHFRQLLLWSFLISMAVLLVASEIVLPGWTMRFIAGLSAYQRYTASGTLGDLITPSGAFLLGGLGLVATTKLCWLTRRFEPDSVGFVIVSAFVLNLSVILFSIVAPYNQVLFIPAVLLIVRYRRELWIRHRASRMMLIVAAVLILWPWAASLVLVPASFIVSAEAIQKTWAVPMWTSIGVPIVILPLIYMLWSGAISRGTLPDASVDSPPRH